MTQNGGSQKREWRGIIEQKHKVGQPVVYHEKTYFKLKDARYLTITGGKYKEDPIVKKRISTFIDGLLIKRGRNYKNGSQSYTRIFGVLVSIYGRAITSVILDVVLRGDRIFLGMNLFSFHIFNMPGWFKEPRMTYRYYRKLNGDYPIMRVGLQLRRLYDLGRARGMSRTAFYLGAGIGKKVSGMITNKIRNEEVKYSDNPTIEIIKNRKV